MAAERSKCLCEERSGAAARWIPFQPRGEGAVLSVQKKKNKENSTTCQLLILEGEPSENPIQISSSSKSAEKEFSSDGRSQGHSLNSHAQVVLSKTAEDATL